MSNNVIVRRVREIKVIKTGKICFQSDRYPYLWQTPTEATRKIVSAENPFEAYKEWVLSVSNEQIELVYAKEDIFQEQEPIGCKKRHLGKEHIKEIGEWINNSEQEGYEVHFEEE